MLNNVKLNVKLLSIVMLNVFLLSVVILSVMIFTANVKSNQFGNFFTNWATFGSSL
jgi:hypothetical protein